MKHRGIIWKSCVFMLCLSAGYILQGEQISNRPRKADAGAIPAGKPTVSFAKLPLSFEANQGQTDARVKFLSHGPGYTLFLTGDDVTLEMQESGVRSRESGARRFEPVSALRPTKDNGHRTASALRLKLVNANQNAVVTGAEELPGKTNYFIGNDPHKWRTNVPTYAKVKYEGVYPGVDLIFYGTQRRLEHDFVVAPGADASRILLRLEGSKKLSLDSEGNLTIAVGGGEVQLLKPLIYQEGSGGRREVVGRYVLKGTREVGFTVSAYDHTEPLVIDPVLAYSTYLGGNVGDYGYHIAVDSSGNAYVGGTTSSSTFPTAAAFQKMLAGVSNAFVAKLNPSGSGLVFSTYLGGSGIDSGFGIAIDSSGDAYVAGKTTSSDFPTTEGALQTKLAGTCNAFLAKLGPSGSALVFSTYVGGSGNDYGWSVTVDSSGNAYLSGTTGSTDFPTTAGAFQMTLVGTSNAFVTKLNPTGSALVYSTYLGSNNDWGWGIAVDSSGNAYVTGWTASINFPTTTGAFQTSLAGSEDAFVSKLNPSGTALVYSTYLGEMGYFGSTAIAVDASGNAYVTSGTDSSDFPTTAGAFQMTLVGTNNAFVAKLNPTGSALVYSTYLGGGYDGSSGIAVDSSGNAYVAGTTSSSNFPTTADAFQTTLAGGQNAFITILNPGGSALVYSTYLGGSSIDSGFGITLDSLGNAYVTGFTRSSNFPTTAGAFQFALAGTTNAFVAKFENTSQAQVTNLQNTLRNLVSAGTLSPALGQFLLVPLNAALAAVNAGRARVAVEDLDLFIGEIRLLVILRQLTSTEGQTLINAANSLIAELRGEAHRKQRRVSPYWDSAALPSTA